MSTISNPTVRSAKPADEGAVKALLGASDLSVDGVHDAFHDFFIGGTLLPVGRIRCDNARRCAGSRV